VEKVFIQNYANFEGRARRAEYWYFVLFNFVLTFGVIMFGVVFAFLGGFLLYPLLGLYSLATFIPNLAVIVRRLHDTGKSGATILIALIPLVGPILLLIYLVTEGDVGPNKYGPDPKQTNGEEIHKIGSSYKGY
jgi:uncharacterized membrane protein YhaH (DUF805 family)